MTEIATIDWFGRWGTSVFSEITAIFISCVISLLSKDPFLRTCLPSCMYGTLG